MSLSWLAFLNQRYLAYLYRAVRCLKRPSRKCSMQQNR
ncbi:UNVERIFIED_CONTAM: hypothetical protein GTU68_038375 [Idotea baltica]|nr:hypothetical protein [Idotea baltica]